MEQPFAVMMMSGASLLALGLAFYAWTRRDAPGAPAFIWLVISSAFWSSFSALHIATGHPLWSKLRFAAIASIALAWLVLTFQFTGRDAWLNRRWLLVLALIPVITQVMVWVNPYDLMWYRFPFDANPMESASTPVRFGPWWWVYSFYSYGLFVGGMLVLIGEFFRSGPLYRLQIGILLIGISFPMATNVAFTLGWLDPTGVDYTAMAFTVTGTLAAWSIFRYRMFDVVPVARDTLIDRMDDGMLVLDAKDRVVDLNPAMQAILNHPEGQVVGRPVQKLPALSPELVAEFHEAVEGRAEIVIGREGVPRYYDLQISPLRDREQRLTGRLIVMRDVTRLKQAEESLRQSNLKLEAHVEELDAFAHTVAHDLKGPLSVVVGFSDLLEKQRMSEENQQQALSAIQRHSVRMGTIIDELLLLASVRKAEEIELEPLDMAAVVAEVQDRLSRMIEEYEAEIVLPDTWPVALGRASWVEEVWANYLSNALKYGGRPPVVKLGATECTDGWIRFWVQDNGPGLDEAQQAQLFTQFTRLHQVRVEGHGLGLSIVQRIVGKLGGEVGVESAPGTGSRFWFSLRVDLINCASGYIFLSCSSASTSGSTSSRT